MRTGKSTFIKRFVDLMVLPNMEDENAKARTRDELPQSAAGKTIMTDGAQICSEGCRAGDHSGRGGGQHPNDRLCGIYGGGGRRTHGE